MRRFTTLLMSALLIATKARGYGPMSETRSLESPSACLTH